MSRLHAHEGLDLMEPLCARRCRLLSAECWLAVLVHGNPEGIDWATRETKQVVTGCEVHSCPTAESGMKVMEEKDSGACRMGTIG